jgi:hypothetical protein
MSCLAHRDRFRGVWLTMVWLLEYEDYKAEFELKEMP